MDFERTQPHPVGFPKSGPKTSNAAIDLRKPGSVHNPADHRW